MMKKNYTVSISVLVIIILIVISWAFYSQKSQNTLEYKNDEFNFSFTLPISWRGYSVITKTWEGRRLDLTEEAKVTGPEIIIRHPLWTAETPRQDIPIMIFTPDEWSLVSEEKLSLGAAPIGPSELGHNSKYFFALPARYNFAFPTGFEEVENIIQNKPLSFSL